jgi:hypothetical protein
MPFTAIIKTTIFQTILLVFFSSCISSCDSFDQKEVKLRSFTDENDDSYAYFRDTLNADVVEFYHFFDPSVIKFEPAISSLPIKGKDSVFIKINDKSFNVAADKEASIYIPVIIGAISSAGKQYLFIQEELFSSIKTSSKKFYVFEKHKDGFVFYRSFYGAEKINPQMLRN